MAPRIEIEVAEDEAALTEFVLFSDRVYEGYGARWPALLPLLLPILTGQSPTAEGRTFRPLVVRRDGEIVARAAAVVDRRYIERWDEPLGHLVYFEALPGTRDEVRMLLDEASMWLRSQGMEAVRTGFGVMDFPYVVDDNETLPPLLIRQNPSYYHTLLKEARFISEKGWVDYRIEVTPDLVARYEDSLQAARASGFDIVPLGEVDPDRRVAQYTQTWNDAFHHHWGASPTTEAENASVFELLGPMGMYDCSVLAFDSDEPVGVLMVTPEATALASLAPGRELRPHEKVNFLGIGVREPARGRGVNMAMASYAYLELIRRGATHLSYTLVLDDNWPSRRTAEKLGADVCANYMVYRRTLKPV